MRSAIEDEATPKTGGSYKPVPTKPTSDRTRAKGVHPMINRHFQCGMRATTQKCETNPISRAPHPANRQKTRNEPNLTPAQDLIMQNEPNLLPQPPGPQPKNTKRTQLPYRWRLAGSSSPPIMRNEPNLSPPRWPKVSPDLSGNPIYPWRLTHCAKHPSSRSETRSQ